MNREGNKKAIAQDDVIDLRKLVSVLLHRAWLIVAAAFLFSIAAYGGTKLLITPTYRTSFTVYVNNTTDQGDKTYVAGADITAARSLVSTYSAILTSQPVLEDAAAAVGMSLPYEQLAELVSISTITDTEIIQVNVTMEDPQLAVDFAQALVDLAPEYISNIVEGSSMKVIAAPKLPNSIYAPNSVRNTEVGFLMGAIFMTALIILLELMDNRVKSGEELEQRYGIAVMGTIPDLAATGKYTAYGYGYGKRKGNQHE